MDEGIVERCINVGNAKHEFTLSNLGTERDGGFILGGFTLLGRLNQQRVHPVVSYSIHHITPIMDKPAVFHADRIVSMIRHTMF